MTADRGGRAEHDRISAGAALLGLRGEPLVLASASPRRRELLERLGLALVCLPANIEEGNRRAHESPAAYVVRLAREKAAAVRARARELGAHALLAADTIVDLEGDVLEKPADRADALRLLSRLEGRWHRVWTGLCVTLLRDEREVWGTEMSEVHFTGLSGEDRERYVDTGEPMDKAGAYGIQGYGGLFVPEIRGDYFNVMGLPLARLRSLVRFVEGGGAGEHSSSARGSA